MYMYVNRCVELVQRGIALQKKYVLLLFISGTNVLSPTAPGPNSLTGWSKAALLRGCSFSNAEIQIQMNPRSPDNNLRPNTQYSKRD